MYSFWSKHALRISFWTKPKANKVNTGSSSCYFQTCIHSTSFIKRKDLSPNLHKYSRHGKVGEIPILLNMTHSCGFVVQILFMLTTSRRTSSSLSACLYRDDSNNLHGIPEVVHAYQKTEYKEDRLADKSLVIQLLLFHNKQTKLCTINTACTIKNQRACLELSKTWKQELGM